MKTNDFRLSIASILMEIFFSQGGNRTTLESSGHVVSDNEIYRYTRVGAGFWGLALDGVGTEVRNNHIHESDSGGIQYQVQKQIVKYVKLFENHFAIGFVEILFLRSLKDGVKTVLNNSNCPPITK